MKKAISALIFVFVMCDAFQALALSDKDYTAMMKDSAFAEADRNLNEAWTAAKESLSPADFAALKKSQSQWLKTGRDNEAQKLMKSGGMSKTQAYAQATENRAEYIRGMFQIDTESDPYSDFADSLKAVADKIMKGKPSLTVAGSRVWAGEKYIIGRSGEYLSDFFTVDPSMTFAGGLRIGSSESDLLKFFGDELHRHDDGTYYSGGIRQWIEFDARGGTLRTIYFTQADAPLAAQAGDKVSDFILAHTE